MRLQLPTSLLLAISICSHLSCSLPIGEQQADAPAILAPRYSVVPIDGGSGGGDGSGGDGSASGGAGNGGSGGSPPVTVVQTVTLPPATTSSPPETQRVTDTIVLTASPAVVTQTAILTVDIDQPWETKTETSVIYITPSSPPSSSPSPPVSSPMPTTPSPPISTSTQGVTTSTSWQPVSVSWQTASSSSTKTSDAVSTTFSSILQTPALEEPATMPSGSPTLIPTTTEPLPTTLSSSSSTFDDGVWHTTYPAWNGTMIRRYARP
ncbi:hypothetical protein NKR19_g2745 [Coniochaeta hoffmannii]|uniref:REJ domain-containing protein n=1 Tax=Coniochaeta hoffmannii TaxID=91930 RepID=A0AA38SA47_9PEZI|nr:hypothetical protein NKR19_g2745 [Coniochaeta hoffmannii]